MRLSPAGSHDALDISETVRDTDIVSMKYTHTRPTQQGHFE